MTSPIIYPARLSSYRETVLCDDPVFFYEFSDTTFTTGTIHDLSKNKNDAINPVQSSVPLEAVGQIGNQRCALFPFVGGGARIQSPVSLTYPEITLETTVASANWGYGGSNVRLIADGHTDQGGWSRAGFEVFLPNAGGNHSGNEPQQLNFIIGNGYTPWQSNTSYVVGDYRTGNGSVWVCVKAGTSGSSEPSFPSGGTNISDGSVVWNWYTADNLWCQTGNIILPGQIYHIVATASVSGATTTISLYLNGVLQAQNSVVNFGTITSPNHVGIGFNPAYDGDLFCGWMGSASAYNYGFSEEQAVKHANAFFAGIVS